MSRTAADVLSGAGAAAAGAGAVGGAGGAGAAGLPPGAAGAGGNGAGGAAPGSAQSRADAFWNGWEKPEQKDVRDFVANKNYESPYELAKAYRELERTRGHNVVPIPRDEYDKDGNLVKADDVGRAAWNKALGVPESADKYDIPLAENNPYPQFKSYIAEVFHQNGVPARMATQLAKGYEGAIQKLEAELRQQEDAASTQGVLELQREWGTAFQENSAIAQRGAESMTKLVGNVSAEQMRAMEHALGTTAYLKMMHAFGAANSEGRFAGADTGTGNRFGNGAADAQSRLDQLQADRVAGKISDHQWRTLQPEIDSLMSRIVAGMPQN